jgi:hypothetical protein
MESTKRMEEIGMVPEMMKAVTKQDFPGGRLGRRPVPGGILGLICILFAVGLAACYNGTATSTSTGATGAGSSGVGWTVNVKIFASTLSLGRGETTSVAVTVRDGSGTAAPRGTRICLSTTNGEIFVDELGKDEPVKTGCVSTSNDIGQLLGTYNPLRTGTDQVQATSMGAFGSATVNISS